MASYVPSREQYREYATRGNLIPVYREVVADADTPVSAYAKVGNRDHSFLLESVLGGEKWAAYSFIGVAPRVIFRGAGPKIEEWLVGRIRPNLESVGSAVEKWLSQG